ncbi:tagaturonate reductase [Fulvivirga sp. M361]|uniref:tagaturonate reductase n=1 Tax=Fulvivirga sp. M361 TaxID=2594266 RepID=UPI00117A0406|nr:tagaturonate reductase [Fulvivirga sp. M361]TRX54300.1 tagaturonate reductase [Fulvivirga sp. M361]
MQQFDLLNKSKLSSKPASLKNRVLQFGEGNFLRAFVDWMIYEMNQATDFDAGVTVVQPIEKGLINKLNDQDGLYNLYLSGITDGSFVSDRSLIDVIQKAIDPYAQFEAYLSEAGNPDLKFIVSNTTEAGIQFNGADRVEDRPASSFPGKLTQLLYRRFQVIPDCTDLIVLPCELIDKNGEKLKDVIYQYADHWSLGADFVQWLDTKMTFCNTLVDRIVPGYPKEDADEKWTDLGYRDELMVKGEVFHLWVIEGPERIQEELPVGKAGLNVVFTDDLDYYRTRKVRILNGAHTSMVPVAYLYGLNFVREAVEDELTGGFVKKLIFEEIIPSLSGDKEELKVYAHQVIDRFRNPSVKHELISISLNSFSKFKTRVLPSILSYHEKEGSAPELLSIAFAALICFYKGQRSGDQIPLNDESTVIDFMNGQWQACDGSDDAVKALVHAVLSNESFWATNLTGMSGLSSKVAEGVRVILKEGVSGLLK